MSDRQRRDARNRRADDGRKMKEAATAARHQMLDDPMRPDKPSEIRHTLFFVGVLVGGGLLNIVALTLLAR